METIKLSCPKCLTAVDWEIEELYNDEGEKAISATETCPDCSEPGDYSDLNVIYASTDSVIGKRVRWYPLDIDDTFDGTIIEEKEHLYVVVPDDEHAPRQNWNKKTCKIIGDS